jgi:hypothetical protein
MSPLVAHHDRYCAGTECRLSGVLRKWLEHSGAAKASFPLKFSYLFIATFHRRITLSTQGEQDAVESEDWFCRREWNHVLLHFISFWIDLRGRVAASS